MDNVIGKVSEVTRQKKNKTRVSIYVDGDYLGSVEDIVWVRSGLKAGDTLSADAWDDMKGRQEIQSALDKALNYLGVRARGKVEMERYLSGKGYSSDSIIAVIEKLSSFGYIDDGEYAKMLVRDRVNLKASGRRVIVAELKRQGIDDETAAEAIAQYSTDDEAAAARRQAEKALRSTVREQDQKKRRAKVSVNLARRGFSSSLINMVIAELFSVETDNTEF